MPAVGKRRRRQQLLDRPQGREALVQLEVEMVHQPRELDRRIHHLGCLSRPRRIACIVFVRPVSEIMGTLDGLQRRWAGV